MNISEIVDKLNNLGILAKVDGKRLLTPKIGINTRIKLYAAAIATRKPVSAIVVTAIETYCMRNEEKHIQEIESIAKLQGKAVEDIVVDEISKKFD